MDEYGYGEEIKIKRKKQPSDKKKSLILEVLTVQAIICLILAVLLFGVNLFARGSVETVKTQYRQTVGDSHDWWEEICAAFQKAFDAVTKTNPSDEEQTLSGAGGEPNPFGPYNRVMAPPDYATFAPFIFTSTITPPVQGRVTSHFGYRYHPITDELDFHKGIDVAVPLGTPIHAAISGTVTKVGEGTSAGKYITLTHGNGLTSTYMHCSEVIAKEGMSIREGEVIAKAGSTGMSTGSHLHLQLAKDGIVFDPSWIVDLSAPKAEAGDGKS